MSGVDEQGQPDREWLKTAEGRAWLETDEGTGWIKSKPGYEWSQLDDGRAWLDELAQRGFEDYFAGEFPEPPEGWLTPESAPRIGARVRMVGRRTTLGGTTFEDGELAIVSELYLMPMGAVRAVVRSVDGRTTTLMFLDEFVQATS